MLAPATGDALGMLAHLTGRTPASLARALPAFGAADARSPVRATTCHRYTARRGILEPVPVHLPAHQKICIRHGIWLSDTGQPHLDLAVCPEIIAAQRRANRLLQRHIPQQLLFTYDVVANLVPPDRHHRQPSQVTGNHHHGTPPDHDAYIHAAIYPTRSLSCRSNRAQPTSHRAGMT
jgi:hypothetical protein